MRSAPSAKCVSTENRVSDLTGATVGDWLVTARSKGKSGKRWHYILISGSGEVIRRRGNEVVAMIREARSNGAPLRLRTEWRDE